MMLLAVAIVTLALLVICKMLYSSFCNPVSFYIIPWGLATILAIIGVFGIYAPGDGTVFLIIVAMISFALGCILMHGIRQPWSSNDFVCTNHQPLQSSSSNGFDFALSSKSRRLLYLLGIIAVVYSFVLASRSIPLLLDGRGLEYIKFQYSNVEGATLYTTHELLLFSWVAQPIIISIMIFFACELCSRRVNWVLLVFSIIGCALYVAISGGRNLLFIFACILLVTLVLSSQTGSALRWIRALPKLIKAIAAALIIAMVVITEQRSLGHGVSVLENVFFYLVGGITYFDQMLANPSTFDLLDGNYMFGWSTFGFILNPLLIVASVIFRFDYIGSDSILSDAANVYLPFSDNLKGNALCTCLYAFVRDFGLPGVFIGPLLFGLMAGFVWEKTFRRKTVDARWLPACVYFMYCVLFSNWRYILVFPSAAVLFLIIIAVNAINKRDAAFVERQREPSRNEIFASYGRTE